MTWFGRSRGAGVSPGGAAAGARWITAAGAMLACGELVSWWASRRLVHDDHGGREAVVVLGFAEHGRVRANAVNRWRVRAGLRSLDGTGPASRLVLSGGAPGGGVSEAALMARYAVQERGFGGDLRLEDRSRSTRENVVNVIPLIEGVDRIKIVSDPLHALRARWWLLALRPDLAARLVRAAEYRVGELTPVKPVFAVVGLVLLSRDRRRIARSDRAR